MSASLVALLSPASLVCSIMVVFVALTSPVSVFVDGTSKLPVKRQHKTVYSNIHV